MQVSQLHAGVCGRPLPIRARPQVAVSRRPFCVEARKQLTVKESRIGKAPITVPAGVTFDVEGQTITVKGKGIEMSETLPDLLSIEKLENGNYKLSKRVDTRQADQLHGLFRSLTNNMVLGLSEGFKKELTLIGVGYRASMSGAQLNLNLGFSHPILMDIPEGLTVQVVKNTTLIINGHDKVAVGDFAAKIRARRKPEPYKGKGVRYVDEFVRKKEGKRGK
jgi:large subunit ribosomal protein L6